jgi:uncharacterized membrane protein YfcA
MLPAALIDLLPLAAAMLAAGVVSGFVAGLLGVGGGIVMVPVLDIALGALGVDGAVRMHLAVATSLATIIPTAVSSSRAHRARGAVDGDLLRRWALPMLAGAVAGGMLAARVHGSTLSLLFGSVALLVSLKMLLPLDELRLARAVPRGVLASTIPAGIGAVSAMMGIGGGTLGVPVLTLLATPIHRAVGTASMFGLLIGIPGTLTYIVAGWADTRLPTGSLGFVSLPGVLLIAPLTVLAAPWGVRAAHGLSKRRLAQAFGIFLLVVATRMLYRALLAG